MTRIEIRYPKLTLAWLCLDCETIFENAYKGCCPICTSSMVFPLSKWIAPIKMLELKQKEEEIKKEFPI